MYFLYIQLFVKCIGDRIYCIPEQLEADLPNSNEPHFGFLNQPRIHFRWIN